MRLAMRNQATERSIFLAVLTGLVRQRRGQKAFSFRPNR
jgi:hypothetical protein